MRRLRLLALAVAVAVPLAACDEGDSGVDVVTGTISGAVTVDGSGLGNVTVTLDGSTTTTTDASGSYSFQDVEAGAHVVSISGFPSDVTFPQTAKSATIASGATSVTVNFDGMQVATSSIVGSVTASGNPLSGVTVSLSGDGSGTATTSADGQYAFTGLVAGDYTVSISGFDAADYEFTSTSQNTNVGVGETSVVSFSGSEAETATLDVTVTVDGSGRSGVGVDIAGPADRSGTTGSNGQVSFDNLPRGTYSVSITNPDPSNISFDRLNASVTISEIGGTGSATFAGSTIMNSSIAGRVYVDVNRNGTYDSGTDQAFEGLDVNLSGAASNTQPTDAEGLYSFGSLAAGSYTVAITNPDPSAYTFDQTSQPVDLVSGQSATANFRAVERRDGAISGRVWFDNGDGQYTSVDEPAANFTISYTGPEGGTVTTNADGQYSISNLLLGEYEVSCDDCDASFMPVSPVTVTLTTSAPTATQNFMSEQGNASIVGRLYIDGNENNTFDVNVDADYPLEGIEVTAEGPDVGEFTTVTTDADGRYEIPELRPGSYNVVVDNATVEAGDPVALGTDQSVQVGLTTGGTANVNYGYDITTWIVQVPVVFGTDGANENPAEGVEITAYGNQDLTNVLDVADTDAEGLATIEVNRAAESSIAGPRDNIIFTQPTSFNAEASINSEPTIEFAFDPNLFEQTAIDDHNLIWNQVFITGLYVERSGDGVPDANVGALGLTASLGVGDEADLSDRTALGAIDVPNDDTRNGGSAFDEDVGEYTFKTPIPRPGRTLPDVYSIQDISGSAQIVATGNVNGFVSAVVDGSQRTVTMPDLLITYPLPNIIGKVWHEANDDVGFQSDADPATEDDDFLNLGLGQISISSMYDADDDGDLESFGCAITNAATGEFVCQDIPADEDVVHLFAQKTAGTAVRLIPEGAQTFSVVEWDDVGADLTVDISAAVDDSQLRSNLGDEPFSYKYTQNSVTVTVFNEPGAGLDGDGIGEGGEQGVRGVRLQLQPTSGTSLGTLADEFPRVLDTDATGVATFGNTLEGEYEVRVIGVDEDGADGDDFDAGLDNIRIVQYDADGNPIFTPAPTDLLIDEIDLQRSPGPATVMSWAEAQYRGGTIGGYIFDNDDDDLEIDPNELLPGKDVDLFADLDLDGNVDNLVSTSTSDADAQYLFEDLWEDTYDVDVVNQPGESPDPARREGLMLVEADAVGTVVPVSGAGEYDPDTDIDNGDGDNTAPGATGEPRLAMNADADDDSDLDFEIIFANTQIAITVVDDAGDPLQGVTVRLDQCGFATSIEGHDADNLADNDGDCTSPTLVTTATTDAAGQITFTGRPEGFWRLDPVETTASAGYVNDEDDHNFWVVRTRGDGDSEARTAQITVP